MPMWSMPSSPGTFVTVETCPFSFGDQSTSRGFVVFSYAIPCG